MSEVDKFARSVGRWALLVCGAGTVLIWLIPAASGAHARGFLFGGLLGGALFRIRVRRVKGLSRANAVGVGRRVGLGSMARLAVMALFLLLIARNPRIDVVTGGLGLLVTNAAVVVAALVQPAPKPAADG